MMLLSFCIVFGRFVVFIFDDGLGFFLCFFLAIYHLSFKVEKYAFVALKLILFNVEIPIFKIEMSLMFNISIKEKKMIPVLNTTVLNVENTLEQFFFQNDIKLTRLITQHTFHCKRCMSYLNNLTYVL